MPRIVSSGIEKAKPSEKCPFARKPPLSVKARPPASVVVTNVSDKQREVEKRAVADASPAAGLRRDVDERIVGRPFHQV